MPKKIINTTLYIVLFLIPLVITPLSIAPTEYNTPKIFLLYICGAILLISLITKFKEFKLDKNDIFIFIFLMLIYLSTIFSVDIKTSIFGASNRYEGMLTFTCYFLIYYCAKYHFKFNHIFIDISLLVILLTSILGILQYYNVPFISDLFLSPLAGPSFSSSTFGNRNFFASFISITLPYIMCLYIFYKEKFYLFVSSVNFYALLVTLTRSAWLAFFVFCIFGFIYIIKKKDKEIFKRALILFLVFTTLFIIFFLSYSDSFLKKIEVTISDISNLTEAQSLPKDVSNENTKETNTSIIVSQKKTKRVATGRLLIWQVAIDLTKSHPILGCGPDAFLEELYENHYSYLKKELYYDLNGVPDKAHNEFLQISSTLGIPALITYLTFLFLTFINLFKSKMLNNIPCFIIFLCLLSYLVQGFFNISTIGIAPIFYFLLGYSFQKAKDLNL